MDRVLVTGGAGFIGSHLVERLVRDGREVVVLDDLSQGSQKHLAQVADDIEFRKGSYGDAKKVRACLKGVDTVFHLGAFLGVKRVLENPWRVFEADNRDLHVFFDTLRKADVKRLVYASSSEVYGEAVKMPMMEDDGLRPQTPYQACKLMGETYCRTLAGQFGMHAVALRYFNVYGPRQESSAYGFVTSIFLENVRQGKPHTVFGTGRQTRDFTFVEDAVEGTVRAATQGRRDVYNIGTGREVTVLELAAAIDRATGRRTEIRFALPRPDEIQRRCADPRAAKRDLGFSAATPLDEGLARTWRSKAAPA